MPRSWHSSTSYLSFIATRVAADVTDFATGLVDFAAAGAQHLMVAVRIGYERRPAVAARLAQMMQPGKLAALAFPVADRILDEFERGVLTEIADRKDRLEHRLQARVLPLGGQAVHLQESLVRFPLDLDQVRNRNRGLDLREILAFAIDILRKAVHRWTSRQCCVRGAWCSEMPRRRRLGWTP